MEFLNGLGLQSIISKIKVWAITKLGEFWGNLKLSRVDGSKSAWEFKAGVIDNTESPFGKSPKIWLNTTDWAYSKWNDCNLDYDYPIVTAPAQYANLTNGGKYQNYYTNSITANPYNGNMKADQVTAGQFKITNGNSSQMIMADGSVKSIAELPNSTVKAIVGVIDQNITSTAKAFAISDEDYQTFMGNGSNTDLAFFQLYTSGTMFARVNRYWLDSSLEEVSGEREARFMAYSALTDKIYVAWPTIYNKNNYLVFATTDNPRSGYHGWWDNTVISQDKLEFV